MASLGMPWTPADDRYLLQNAHKLTWAMIGEDLHRSRDAVKSRFLKLRKLHSAPRVPDDAVTRAAIADEIVKSLAHQVTRHQLTRERALGMIARLRLWLNQPEHFMAARGNWTVAQWLEALAA